MAVVINLGEVRHGEIFDQDDTGAGGKALISHQTRA